MLRQLLISLGLVILGASSALAFLAHEEPPQRLPLIHAGFQICRPVGPQDDGDDADSAPEGTPDTQMWRPEPDHQAHVPERPIVA